MADDYKSPEEKGLRRVLGLPAALTIGLGVMIGSGIFVFPGLAGGRAGIGAAISFGLAGLVALIVALCMAELATAIPRSGGAYYFISRGMGAFWGTIVGLSLWVGLIFATGFYLVAFGHYAVDLLGRFGIISEWKDSLPLYLAAAGSILLTGINLMGARKAGKLQRSVVILLVLIIAGFLSVGLLKSLGIGGELPVSRKLPNDWTSAVLGTSALIFTSYLGFAQIANISGEVKKPRKNLPIALGGSVLIAATIYVLTMVVITGVFSIHQLEDMGEMAMVELGRTLFGSAGAFGCFAIVFFMTRKAQIMGAVLVFASIIWFSLYASGEQTRRSRNK